MKTKRQQRTRRKPRGLRGVLFRLMAVLISLSPLVVCEIVLRSGDWGRATEIEDPYIGFTDVRPLFELDDSGQYYEIAKSRRAFFHPDEKYSPPDHFAATKASNGFRVFCLGGSTVQGEPYLYPTAFPAWLELSLQAADPNRRWEVVNCGGVSYASYRLTPILREVLQYEPDLIVLYTGHNEFLEDRTYQHIKDTPELIAQSHNWMSRFRTYCLARRIWLDVTRQGSDEAASRSILPAEVDAILEHDGFDEAAIQSALDQYHRDDRWRQGVVDHFQFNLLHMIQMAREANVPVLLVNPACNLKDSPPFKTHPSGGLSDAQQTEFDRLLTAAVRADTDAAEALTLCDNAIAIDNRHAGAHFLRGQLCQRLHRYHDAHASYVRAKDEDICPLRIIEPLRDVIGEVADQTETPWIDIQGRFEKLSPQGITGDELLEDHVHPKIHGHQEIATALFEQMEADRFVHRTPGFEKRRDAQYARHYSSLPSYYEQRGQQRLEGLRRFTQGRAVRLRGAKQDSP